MTERPILFKGEMVRAILDGRKTQTRRIIPASMMLCLTPEDEPEKFVQWCKYGVPGDRLWVRETWTHSGPDKTPGYVSYRADGEFIEYFKRQGYKWRPSIFMPRWASRITLEIVNVRVQRVQEITQIDAMREGVAIPVDKYPIFEDAREYVQEFGQLWDSINAPRGFGWDDNPWVWVIEFKRI